MVNNLAYVIPGGIIGFGVRAGTQSLANTCNLSIHTKENYIYIYILYKRLWYLWHMIYQFLLHLFKTHVFVTYILSDTEKMEILKRAGFYCPNTFGQEMFFFCYFIFYLKMQLNML